MQYEKPWKVESKDDCYWYHSMDLPGVGHIDGDWDLRGQLADDYVGGFDFKDLRVLDIGCGSGALSFYAEQRGAKEVVAFDQSPDHPMNLLPCWDSDLSAIERMKKGFWFSHKAFNSRVKAFYGDVYDLPGDLGAFDVALFGSILLHLENPIGAIRSVSKLSKTVIVTDCDRGIGEHIVFRPCQHPENNDYLVWWAMGKETVGRMLESYGYTCEYDACTPVSPRYGTVPMYIVTGKRPWK